MKILKTIIINIIIGAFFLENSAVCIPIFSQTQASTHGDFALVFLKNGGNPEELLELCNSKLCNLEQIPKINKKLKDDRKNKLTTKVKKEEESKLEMLKDLQRKVSKALNKLKFQEKPKGKMIGVKKLKDGYQLRFQGGQTQILPPIKAPVAWFNVARDNQRNLVAIKFIDDEGKHHRLIRINNKWREILNLEGVVERGSFSGEWFRSGGAPHLLSVLQQSLPSVNLSKIQRGFKFQVLIGPGNIDKKLNIKAINYVSPEPVIGTNKMQEKVIRGIRAGNKFVSPKSNQFVAENWPISGLTMEEFNDRLIFVAPRSFKPGKKVISLMKGKVGVVNRDWLALTIDYENGYSVFYDGVKTQLKSGDTINGGEEFGIAPYGTITIKVKTGLTPFSISRSIPKLKKAYNFGPAAKLRGIFESPQGVPDKNQLAEIKLWNFLVDYFSKGSFPKDSQG